VRLTSAYRIVHGDDVIDWLAIGTVQRILAEAGVDVGDLEDASGEQVDDQPGQAGEEQEPA
jgi:bifunctional non-homologous end joining protein LigD